MFIKPFVKETSKNILEKILITILVLLGVFFMVIMTIKVDKKDKKFEIADLITGDTYLLTQDDFYFSGSDIVIKKQGQKIIQFSKYTYKPI
jgi:uncharacterized protein YpmB